MEINKVVDSIKQLIIIFALKTMSRIFIALTAGSDLNKELVTLKSKMQQLIVPGTKVNWSDNKLHHLTVFFVGNMEPEQLEEMYIKLENIKIGANVLELEIPDISYYPNENSQLLACNIILSANLKRLYNQVEQTLATIGFSTQLKNYRPHITLARFRDKTRPFIQIYDIKQPIKANFIALDVYESSKRKNKTSHELINSFKF